MSVTCDLNRVQKVHLSETFSEQIPGKSIPMIFNFLFSYTTCSQLPGINYFSYQLTAAYFSTKHVEAILDDMVTVNSKFVPFFPTKYLTETCPVTEIQLVQAKATQHITRFHRQNVERCYCQLSLRSAQWTPNTCTCIEHTSEVHLQLTTCTFTLRLILQSDARLPKLCTIINVLESFETFYN